MIIPIDDKYRIDTDEHSWRVSKSRMGKKGIEWRPISYHLTLEQAVKSLYDLNLRLSNAEGVVEVQAEADRTLRRLTQALAPSFEHRLTQGEQV